MSGQRPYQISRILPERLIRRLRWSRLTRRLVHRWARERDVKIVSGVATGLQFNASVSNPAYALGTNEPPVQEALAQNLRPGDVFYDIGANVGFFSVIGAQLVGSEGFVYAFEPVPENVSCVERNASLNGFRQIIVLPKAVAEADGQGELLLAHFSGGSALSTVDTPPPDLKEVMMVDVVSIDSLVSQQEIEPPALVKIDVEGAEINVLRGMSQTISDFRPIIIYEIDDVDETSFGRKQEVCAAFLQDRQYAITRLEDSYEEIDWHVAHFVATPK